MVSFGDFDPFPVFESCESGRFRFIGPVGNPSVVNEYIAEAFASAIRSISLLKGNQAWSYPARANHFAGRS